jgi:ubiquinone/menaquinone biosynthesis C-methylase UbiE
MTCSSFSLMSDPTKRFSNRVENYIKFRPGYPEAVIDLLTEECGLNQKSIIADVGSGTGILSELLLKNGNRVVGIEPNTPMRVAGEKLLERYSNFTSINGTAEATTLSDNGVDFVLAGQAFHWFDQKLARDEFSRILKPSGWIMLLWNERRIDSTPFLRAYERMLLKFGTDYQEVRHERVYQDVESFFSPREFKLKTFDNLQSFDFQGVKGRLLSSSYVPAPDHKDFEAMLEELRKIFEEYQKAGEVAFEHDTKVYFGQLKN